MTISIIGTGKIANEVLAMISQHDLEIKVKSICSHQNVESAARLAREYRISKVYTDYDLLLEEDDADFIYIANVNDVHYRYAMQALLRGRNVIVEKPMCLNSCEAEELIQTALKRKLYLFDAVTFRYMPNFESIKNDVHKIGRIRLVECNYSQYSSRYDRYCQRIVTPAFDPSHAGGALTDLNIYNLAFVASLFGSPLSATYHPNKGWNGIDTSGVAMLQYQDFVATCLAAKDTDGASHVSIQGENGTIYINGSINECCDYILSLRGQYPKQIQRNRSKNRLFHEFEQIASIYSSNDFEKSIRNLNEAVTTIRILDLLREEVVRRQGNKVTR